MITPTKLFFCLLVINLQLAKAQTSWTDWNYKARYAGYIIYTGASDTVKGWIEFRSASDNQEQCIFYGQQNDKKPVEKYSADQIKAYGINGRHYRSIYYSGGLISSKLRFNLLFNDAGIGTYKWLSDGKESDVFAKINDPKTVPHTQDYFVLKFKSKMAEFVADYPELSKKIADGEKGYGIMKIFDIFDEYNKWYANGKK